MMEVARTSETSVNNYFTRQYIPEDKSEHDTDQLSCHKNILIISHTLVVGDANFKEMCNLYSHKICGITKCHKGPHTWILFGIT
jgi:hypothetical protein